jgi:V/A-type H+-transporting ATPase subunit C
VLRAVHHGLSWEAIAPHVCDLGEIGTVDLRRLVRSHDASAMAEGLAGTPYAAAFRGALHRLEEAGPFAVEVALELDYYERLWGAAGTLAASDVGRARHLLGILFDVLNLEWIARYRDALDLSPEEILNYTLREGRWLTPQARRRLAESRGEPWGTVLAHTPYGRVLAGADRGGVETPVTSLWRFLAKEVERALIGYPFHVGVPLGFLLAQEIEIRDLGVLLAAKGMAVPAAEVFKHLVTVRH